MLNYGGVPLITHDYAQELRIGESARDASDKIRGFFYQDFFAIQLLIKAKHDDKIYVEWVEDIYVENDTEISLFQIKHYPKSVPQFLDVFKGMYYQFLKYKLFEDESNKKEINSFFYCHTTERNYIEISEEEKKRYVTKGSIKSTNNYEFLKTELNKCKNMGEREELLFNNISSQELLDQFKFEIVKTSNIDQTRDSIKSSLFDKFHESFVGAIIKYPKEIIQNILLAVAVQYVQNCYYKKGQDQTSYERSMTNESFSQYINNIIKIQDESLEKTINFFVISYIDDIFYEMQQEIAEDYIAFYEKLYLSTKDFLLTVLNTKERRFKFLNSISTQDFVKLNRNLYMEDKENEIKYFLEHKESIDNFIWRSWKFMFNLECSDFQKYIKEYSDCFMFNFEGEKISPALLPSSAGNTKREASHLLRRTLEMKEKPKKWYLKGSNVRGRYKYSFDVNKIDDAKLERGFNISNLEDEIFLIKCVKCLEHDQDQMDKKDRDLNKSIFHFNCIEEDIHGDF